MTYKTYEVRVHNNGTQSWWLNGERHRENGPAYISVCGTKQWYLNGKLHREDGPALIGANGVQEWWVNGNRLTEEQFNKRTKSCAGKIVEIDGKKI